MAPIRTLGRLDAAWTDGVVATPLGDVPRVRTQLTTADRVGMLKARCGIGRMNYRVLPGVYAVGNPTGESPVLVSANYKFSFDWLRSVLGGRDAWLLVLDTHGINVWCAAGKGIFGTDELVRRVMAVGLRGLVSHRRLVVPQLAATGVSAHAVRERCGFSVTYGPVRADDLPAFLDARMKAAPDMRRVHFTLRDRAVLIPVEIVGGSRYLILTAAAFLLLSGLNAGGYSLTGVANIGVRSAAFLTAAFLVGTVLGPLSLPYLPGRAFAFKGALLGLAVAVCAVLALGGSLSPLHAAAWALIVPTVTSFVVMTFTGSSTYTSLSGVLREMRVAVPIQIGAGVVGTLLWVAGLFVGGGLGR
jgi:hypothetical protein